MRVLALTALLMTAFLAGCTTTDGEGSASIYVKDAPTDEFSEIHVVFTEVLIHKAGDDSDESGEESGDAMGGNETAEGNETEESGSDAGWIALFENATGQDVDLLSASGDSSVFLGEANLTAGKYTQIRIVTSDAYGIDLEGNRINFTVPSGVLKINHPFDVVAGEETKITVDYDLDRSLKQAGPNGWKMTPVIGSTVTEQVDDEESGEEAHDEGELVE